VSGGFPHAPSSPGRRRLRRGRHRRVLLLLFDDREGHKQYQEDPATRRFSEKHGRRWEMVKALDVLVR